MCALSVGSHQQLLPDGEATHRGTRLVDTLLNSFIRRKLPLARTKVDHELSQVSHLVRVRAHGLVCRQIAPALRVRSDLSYLTKPVLTI